MFKSFEEVEKYILEQGLKKKLALAAAHDDVALDAVVYAKRRGVIDGILIGDKAKILELLKQFDEPDGDYEIIDEPNEKDASFRAVKMVREGEADIEMKGRLPSADYLLPIMNPFDGLMEFDSKMSECTAFYYPDQDRIMFATDCALSIDPSPEEKVKLTENAIELARAFGFEAIKVAAIAALETVNPEMPETQVAADLADMDWGEGVEFAGPFALDNALDLETAKAKGITSDVAGCADILLMPDLSTGNVFHKSLHYFGHMQCAGVVCGTNKPVVFTSRSDSANTKYNSILSAILQSIALGNRS